MYHQLTRRNKPAYRATINPPTSLEFVRRQLVYSPSTALQRYSFPGKKPTPNYIGTVLKLFALTLVFPSLKSIFRPQLLTTADPFFVCSKYATGFKLSCMFLRKKFNVRFLQYKREFSSTKFYMINRRKTTSKTAYFDWPRGTPGRTVRAWNSSRRRGVSSRSLSSPPPLFFHKSTTQRRCLPRLAQINTTIRFLDWNCKKIRILSKCRRLNGQDILKYFPCNVWCFLCTEDSDVKRRSDTESLTAWCHTRLSKAQHFSRGKVKILRWNRRKWRTHNCCLRCVADVRNRRSVILVMTF